MSLKTITINSRAYDGSIRRSWAAELLEVSGTLIRVRGVFDLTVDHTHLGIIRRGTISHEYFWLDRWYNVFRFHEPEGDFRGFYCNVSMPPRFSGSVLDYVDLDVDMVAGREMKAILLDEEEFRERAEHFGYPVEVRENTAAAVSELKRMIGSGEFPFDRFN